MHRAVPSTIPTAARGARGAFVASARIGAMSVLALVLAVLAGASLDRSWLMEQAAAAFVAGLLFVTLGAVVLTQFQATRRHAKRETLRELASMAHDLKGPLSTVTSYVDLIAESALGPVNEGTRVAAQSASDASMCARELVESTLLLHAEGLAARGVGVCSVDLRELIRDVTDALRAEIAGKQAQVTVEPLPRVMGSVPMLFRVLENLVQNAVEYCRPGEPPVVVISGSSANDRAEIAVWERGIGIAAQDAERVFQDAARAIGARVTADGHGLGLATMRRMVRELGGEVWVDVSSVEGTTVRLSLPIAP